MNIVNQKYIKPITAQKLAAGYVRCSTDAQAETSPEQQRNIILDYAEKTNYRIIEWFIDVGKSGTSFEKRPEFSRLKATIESHPAFNAVIALDESRWGRAGAADSIYYKCHFKKVANVDVLIVRSMANTGNPTIDAMLGAFEGGLSREESEKKAVRTYDGCLSAIKHGYSAGGTAPYGYRRVAINRFSGERRILGLLHDKDSQVILNDSGNPIAEQTRPKEEYTVWEPGDPEEVAVVRKIFDLRIRLGFGYAAIANRLNIEKTACPKRGNRSNKDQKWSIGTIRGIIINPVYRGARVYDRLKKKGIGKYAPRFWEKDKTRWTIVENAHDAIVSQEDWILANPTKENSERGALSRKRFDNPYLLSGLMKCSHCGFSFNGRLQTIGRPNKRKKIRTYADSAYFSKGPSVCSFMSFNAEPFENRIIEEIKKSIQSQSTIETVKKTVKAYFNQNMNNSENISRSIEKQIQDKTNRINSLLKLAEDGIQLDTMAARIKELQQEKRELEQARQEATISETHKSYDLNIEKKVVEFFNEFEKNFKKAPISERKVLIHQMIDRIVIDKEKRIANCYILKLPKQELHILQANHKGNGTPFLIVPPTRFELVFQA